MSDAAMDMAGARALSLTELFALERREFVPSLVGAGMAGFRARMPVTSLDGETQAEEPEIDPALAREEELAAARDESFQAGLEAGRTGNLEAVDRKSVVWGKGVTVRVDFGGGGFIKKKTQDNKGTN